MSDDLELRAATDEDLPAIIGLLRDSMDRADDPRFEALFRWKHLENPFGRSPMWVACAGERLVGLRTFMRWEFERAGTRVRCVRAVDTATHPEFQGLGIFRRLTLDALPGMAADGVQFVFNTPNSQSRPGYLKMGWREIGRAKASVRPLSLAGGVRLARNRVPASHWSEPTEVGEPAADVLATSQFRALITNQPGDGRLRTRADQAYFSWRYGTSLLEYRAVPAPNGIDDGVALLRFRRRGNALEVGLATLVVPERTPTSVRALLKHVLRTVKTGGDYVVGLGAMPYLVSAPTFGPVLTTRDVAGHAPVSLGDFDLALGDVELF